MGSFKHPRVFTRVEFEKIKAAFHEIIDALSGQDVFMFVGSEEELKTHIIRELILLASRDTPPRHLKSEVLKALTLR
jgi:hypothetical protein